jgi:hypothetical protein
MRMYVNAGMLLQARHWFDMFYHQMNSECFSMVLAEKAFICCLKKMLNVCVQCYDQRI